MALVVRYFSTSSAGAGDGTSWADRAALFTTGNWSSVITGFDFSGSDSMECRIEGGLTYTCSQSLATGLFSNAPTVANPLMLHGCDSSGNKLSPPDPDWVSAQPAFTDTSLPTIDSTTNITQVNLTTCQLRLTKHTASGRNGAVILALLMDWGVVSNSTSNSSAGAVASVLVSNSVLSCSGSSYGAVASQVNAIPMDNVRVEGVAGSSGNRDGVAFSGTTARNVLSRLTVVGNGGRGIAYTGSNAGVTLFLNDCTVVGNAGDQVQFPNTASQTNICVARRCLITGGGAYGINPGANTNLLVSQCRLRDNTSGNLGTFGNYPTDLNNYTTDSDDATEYVNAAGGDYRIKYGSAIWGMGFGAGDEPAPAGGANRAALGSGLSSLG